MSRTVRNLIYKIIFKVGGFVCVCAQVLSCVRLFVTLWAVAPQAPLSMEYFRQE